MTQQRGQGDASVLRQALPKAGQELDEQAAGDGQPAISPTARACIQGALGLFVAAQIARQLLNFQFAYFSAHGPLQAGIVNALGVGF
ncbi:hypothetical protein AACH06_02715 [Ideonella sp. DXS29W]|uniref:Uncharacterized protein n=1 Tax=Ideonella lacteola TaxID=2984193 RepID=A0ABU9BIR9_9BURK